MKELFRGMSHDCLTGKFYGGYTCGSFTNNKETQVMNVYRISIQNRHSEADLATRMIEFRNASGFDNVRFLKEDYSLITEIGVENDDVAGLIFNFAVEHSERSIDFSAMLEKKTGDDEYVLLANTE